MRKLLWVLAGLIVVVLGLLGGVLAFDTPARLPPLASLSVPFDNVDFGDLPAIRTYAARDGAKLGYRVYEGGSAQVVVLMHGVYDEGAAMHPLAKALRDAGATVYVPVVRGHGYSRPVGDIDYIGQLEDDLADFVAVLRPLHPNGSLSLIGFSAGGGFVLRVMATPDEKLFDRFMMISPALPGAPTMRPWDTGRFSVATPRIIALTLLNLVGIDWFNGLPVVTLATSPMAPNMTSVYSFRLVVDFGAPQRDYLAALARNTKPAALLVGANDEVFFPDRFAPLFKPARPDLPIIIVPDVSHVGMIVTPEGIAAIRKSFLELTGGPSTG
ncbi:MAG TPA: alpha/beta fold hydrolase [Xanthobacteraceae bacterium]|nr:alpha/beta fold hydrolase [Xanthobacteraceae bacterium]